VRWWNVKHPQTYASRLSEGMSPVHAREVLTPEDRRVERILLELRLADGLATSSRLTSTERDRIADLCVRGLATVEDGKLILTLGGRLVADGVIRDLVD
jgi:oxygen-independent coproporphyrinogen-3 oxidase